MAATVTHGLRPAYPVLAETGHYVHVDDPDLVEREIREILERSGVLEDPTPEAG